MKVLKKISKVINTVSAAWGLVSAAGLFFLAAVTFIDVGLRYFLGSPIKGSQEFVEFMMIITIYGGLPYAVSKGMMLTVEAVTVKFNPTVRKILVELWTAISIVALAYMFYKVFGQYKYYHDNPMQRSSILKWSYAPFYFYAAVSLALMAVETFILFVRQMIVLICPALEEKNVAAASETAPASSAVSVADADSASTIEESEDHKDE